MVQSRPNGSRLATRDIAYDPSTLVSCTFTCTSTRTWFRSFAKKSKGQIKSYWMEKTEFVDMRSQTFVGVPIGSWSRRNHGHTSWHKSMSFTSSRNPVRVLYWSVVCIGILPPSPNTSRTKVEYLQESHRSTYIFPTKEKGKNCINQYHYRPTVTPWSFLAWSTLY